MKVKFTGEDLESSNYLGEGQFVCTITKVEEKQSKTGKQMIEVEMTNLGKTTRDWFLTSEHVFKLGGFALACGFPDALLKSGDFDTKMLLQRKLVVTRKKTGKEVYDGKEKDKWESIYSRLGSDGETGTPGNNSDAARTDDIPF